MFDILEIFSGWDGRLAVWGEARAVMSDFEIGELHDIQLFSGILERPSI